MPNWCWTNYVIEGDKKEIADLHQKMQSLEERKTPLIENGFGKNWMGNLVTLLGGDWNEIECRGDFMNLEKPDDTTIRFDTETAWKDMPDVWDFVCKQYKSLRYYFLAEESGACYYATSDKEGKYFPERFFVEQRNAEKAYYESDTALFKDIAERTGIAVTNEDEMLKAIESYYEKHENDPILVYQYEIV
jgi:hypothetical protein